MVKCTVSWAGPGPEMPRGQDISEHGWGRLPGRQGAAKGDPVSSSRVGGAPGGGLSFPIVSGSWQREGQALPSPEQSTEEECVPLRPCPPPRRQPCWVLGGWFALRGRCPFLGGLGQ